MINSPNYWAAPYVLKRGPQAGQTAWGVHSLKLNGKRINRFKGENAQQKAEKAVRWRLAGCPGNGSQEWEG